MKVTKELLNELGSCGDYVRTFMRTFPTTNPEYADGVEPTSEVCVANAADFSWSWAAETMLASDAYDEWCARTQGSSDELRVLLEKRSAAYATFTSDIEAWKLKYDQQYNEPGYDASYEVRESFHALRTRRDETVNQVELEIVELNARVFGELFADPSNHSPKVTRAHEVAERQRETNERAVLRTARSRVTEIERSIAHWRTADAEIERLQGELTEAQDNLGTLEKRDQQRQVARAQARVETALRALEVAQENVKRAEDAVEKISSTEPAGV